MVQGFLEKKILPFVQKQEEQKFFYRKKDFTEEMLKKVLGRYGH